ncbi:MAG: bifunctional precorrin-2 dehydrogenase/sirohydrochlorin ferrochelatase [Desulfurococcales archaeon]|nr:bifunctional precorrin-2 dehydrogenase/sirohydrochlorin ferrochelatase [Desulfurococcales archaeon]
MYIPLYIDVEGMRIAVIGGGNVGTRRARYLSSKGANVVVYSKDFSPDLRDLDASGILKLKYIDDDTTPEDLARELHGKYSLIVIATDDLQFNSKLSDLLRKKGVLVNNATKASTGNVVFPFHSEVYDGGLELAITSLGRTGIASRIALEHCTSYLENNEYLRNLFNVMSLFKKILIECISDPKERVPLYFKVDSDGSFHELIKKGFLQEALARALEVSGLPAECLSNPPD